MERVFFVYILASRPHGTLYAGMTSDLSRRVFEHRARIKRGFTDTYDVVRLVWYERHPTAMSAIGREKQIKKWRRDWKIRMIEEANPDWSDLYLSLASHL